MVCGIYVGHMRRNVIYLYCKKSHLYQLFHNKVPDMISLSGIFVQKTKEN